MLKQTVDPVSARIDERLRDLPSGTSKPCIFRVHARLRKENEKAYEPEILAIGPYHHGKDNLQEIEKHKLLYLNQLLRRRNESSVGKYVTAVKDLADSARKCYAETINFSTEDFVEMMILGGCFIIELFRKLKYKKMRDNPDDPILLLDHVENCLTRDLMLFENQLPFFILDKLFEMTKSKNSLDNIINLAVEILGSKLPAPKPLTISPEKVEHLLHLMHFSCCSSFAERGVSFAIKESKLEFIKSTTELLESGIKFTDAKESTSVLDIKFENRVMKIPTLVVDDNTDCLLRNLIAYEQYNQVTEPRYVTDYMKIMDCLINSAKDAEILRHKGIINNCLGDDEAICTMFTVSATMCTSFLGGSVTHKFSTM